MNPRHRIAIVTYNSAPTLPACLESVLSSIGPADEVVVVDNASRDASRDILGAYAIRDSRLAVRLSDENLGFAAGTNLGLGDTTADFLVMLNPDTVVTAGWLERMRAQFEGERIGAVGPTSSGVSGDQRVQLYLPPGFAPGSLDELCATLAAAQRPPVSTKMLVGFCMMLSRAAVDEVGLLDPELFLGLDDLDISWRLRLADYRLRVATDVYIHHVGRASFDTEPRSWTDAMQRHSADVLARKLEAHYGRGRAPTGAELWDLHWFNPSWDIWSPRPTCFVADAPEAADAAQAAFVAAFGPADPVRLLLGDARQPDVGEAQVRLGPGPEIPGELRIAVPTAELLRQAANCLPAPRGDRPVSVVSIVRCGRDAMHLSLESLLLHTPAPLELIVVEAGGDPGCRAYLEDFVANHRPETLLLRTDDPVEFAEGANLGVDVATSDTVAILAGDTIVTPGWIERLLQALDARPDAGGVAPRSNKDLEALPYDSIHALYDFARGQSRKNAGRARKVPSLALEALVCLKAALEATLGIPGGPPTQRETIFAQRLQDAGRTLWLCEDVYVHRNT